MSHSKKIFSDEFITRFVQLAEGFFSPGNFEKLIAGFETEALKYHRSSISEANLLRILNSLFDRISFFQDCLKYPHHSEIVTAISHSSNYLTDIVVRNPEYLYQVFDNHYLNSHPDFDQMDSELRNGIQKFKTYETRLNFLRQFKKRMTLKIGLCDILGIADINMITGQLSILAKAITSVLFKLSYLEILNKYEAEDNEPRYCLLSLGKLGGRELNYSSDTDFILFYDDNSPLKNNSGREYFEILSEAALLFIKSSTAVTNRGYIYRVDFRLRPDGKNSPLCKAVSDYIRYYETRGEDWERQMLIKMDFACGNRKLYDYFSNYLQTYIYPSSFSGSITDQILRMKSNIEKHHAGTDNVKTFQGGIRNIEFAVQGIQLLNGGKHPSIRSGNTLEALELIQAKNFITKEESATLKEAYIFYRRTEHFLQLMNDNQTHVIPQSGDNLDRLANYLHFENPELLKIKLEEHRRKVLKIYHDALSGEVTEAENIEKINFSERARSLRNLEYLRTGKGLFEQKEFDSRTISAFQRIEYSLAEYLLKSNFPDKVLENFVKILRTITLPSIWYSEFTNEKLFRDFLYLCEYSQKAVNLMMFEAGIREMFLSRKVFLKKHAEYFPDYSLSDVMFIGAVQFALKLIDHQKLSSLIGSYIDFRINKLLGEEKLPYNYMIAALGSYGSESMSFASDVDLLVVVDTVEGHPEIQNDFQNFLQNAKKELRPVEVDFRLRPEGKKSQLVWDIKNYREYFFTRARVWEFQTIRKMRFVAGDKRLFNALKNAASARLAEIPKSVINSEMKNMFAAVQREFTRLPGKSLNLKKEKGGLQTLDFATSKIVMNSPELYKKSFSKSISQLIRLLKKISGINSPRDISVNYDFLKTAEAANQNIWDSNTAVISGSDEMRRGIYIFLGFKNDAEFEIKLNSIMKNNSRFYEDTFEE